jgi:lipid-A-disaccharide synthase
MSAVVTETQTQPQAASAQTTPHLYLVAGEVSGDTHAAALMEALRERSPGVRFSGAGGDAMRALGAEPFLHWTDAAVVGLWDVLKNYRYFKQRLDAMVEEVLDLKPDLLVTVDYPGFNLRLAKAVKARRPEQKTAHYISPQVWAWNRGRIPKMAAYLDAMLCIFPFEAPLYEASGLHAEFVGHPLIDELRAHREDPHPRERGLVGLFPGSREREVVANAPAMLAAAQLLRVRQPSLKFEIACAKPRFEPLLVEMITASGLPFSAVQIRLGHAHQLMQRAQCAMMASGTATLEAAFFGLPYCIVYKVAWLTWEVGKRLVKVDHLGIVNILSEREVVREFLQTDAQPAAIAEEIRRLLDDHAYTNRLERGLEGAIAKLTPPGEVTTLSAPARAAEALLRMV